MYLKYKCNVCSNEISKYFPPKATVAPFISCGQCGGILEKQLPDFEVSSVETVDNGIMARKVELRKDAFQKAKAKGDKYVEMLEKRDRLLKKDEE